MDGKIVVDVDEGMSNKYLTFKLDDEFYGFDIYYVNEIVGMQQITVLPEYPEFIKGIINLRGKIVPVMDMRLRFNKEVIEYNDRTCIIVIEISDFQIGVIVDEVSEVLDLDLDQIVPPPDISSQGRKYIKSIGKYENQVILIIDCEALLTSEEMNILDND